MLNYPLNMFSPSVSQQLQTQSVGVKFAGEVHMSNLGDGRESINLKSLFLCQNENTDHVFMFSFILSSQCRNTHADSPSSPEDI